MNVRVMIAAAKPDTFTPRLGKAKIVALSSATSNEVAIAIAPTCKVTPTALKKAGSVLSMKAVSKLRERASARGHEDNDEQPLLACFERTTAVAPGAAPGPGQSALKRHYWLPPLQASPNKNADAKCVGVFRTRSRIRTPAVPHRCISSR
ncbi:hypothetical protein WR25_26786 [Diploscapter pachys]|uniref:Uncharacterized protein n=1 Tax=Diploscapter pachys TaxID=2018661 RepID=A0A2A2K5A8_9BILA|nr:hypothetical protein WR25_26786 [Diploscapter pachys]